MTTTPESRKKFALYDLHPDMRSACERLLTITARHNFRVDGFRATFEPFEGFRSPERQNYLFTSTKSTKARPWQSAHQYGLGVDFAVRIHKADVPVWSWSNEAPWLQLKSFAQSVGLDIPIAWDKGHVEHPHFNALKKLWK